MIVRFILLGKHLYIIIFLKLLFSKWKIKQLRGWFFFHPWQYPSIFADMAHIKLLDGQLLDITLSRLSQELIENHGDFSESVILGLQPKGIFVAERIRRKLAQFGFPDVPLGYLDITFYRDDFRRRGTPIKANETHVPFIIEGKQVILIDDVLYTGRSVRAAMSAMMAFGRPEKVELLALIDRKYSRDVPIEPNYIGRTVNTIESQKVRAQWMEQGFDADNIWLVNDDDS